jgi:hypothetical protein
MALQMLPRTPLREARKRKVRVLVVSAQTHCSKTVAAGCTRNPRDSTAFNDLAANVAPEALQLHQDPHLSTIIWIGLLSRGAQLRRERFRVLPGAPHTVARLIEGVADTALTSPRDGLPSRFLAAQEDADSPIAKHCATTHF